jgi:hypothetical protein
MPRIASAGVGSSMIEMDSSAPMRARARVKALHDTAKAPAPFRARVCARETPAGLDKGAWSDGHYMTGQFDHPVSRACAREALAKHLANRLREGPEKLILRFLNLCRNSCYFRGPPVPGGGPTQAILLTFVDD